ncbi:nucleoside hydrolase [Sphingomonas sp.]|uniref:nucleoside hydrolase n=1 Tax=Sphingomonas sp. TaxID=28214 RepID=UPI000DB64368|nr:nucleoside hydrolase [Sphingomonas sp.]PZU08012.1 MAG: nucleoside hydrolase [Sphingomonas sp.]
MRKIILDVDTGTDDAVAIMLAHGHPALELVACTTVNGNTAVEHCTDNTLRVLDLIGAADIPVFQGLHRPIVRPDLPIPRAKADVGASLHGNTLPLPETALKAQEQGAVEFLIETYRSTTDEITLVPLAPLSNIAAALALYPKLVDLIPDVVIMGGCHAFGNRTASAEFNIWADPEAAAVVLSAGFRKITLVPLDATYNAALSTAQCEQLAALGTPAALAAADIIRNRIANYDRIQPIGQGGLAPVHDALAVASIVDPTILVTRFLHVEVETTGTATVGRTVIDTTFRGADRSQPANCNVAFAGDADRFAAILLEALKA